MDETNTRWRSWLRRLADGDGEIVEQFWAQYGARLQSLAAAHLNARMRRREAPEDVVQSVCRTFFRRVQAGKFEIADRESLWRLLCAITLAKTRQKARFHCSARRSVNQEDTVAPAGEGTQAAFREPAAEQPAPDEEAEFLEELELLLDGLDEEERRLLELKLQECTNEEAAEKMGCSERTVRRILKRVQNRLRKILDEP